MANFFWILLTIAIFWTQSIQARMRNVCEGQPSAEGVAQRLVARNSVAAVAGVTINVNLNLNYSESIVGSPSVKSATPTDTSQGVVVHKERSPRVVIETSNLCPWVHRIEKHDSCRLPSYIVRAELLIKPEKTFFYNSIGGQAHCLCVPIVSNLTVLSFFSCVNGTERWKQDTRAVTIGFTCVNII